MKSSVKKNIRENLVYVALWTVLLVAPIVSLYVRSSYDSHMEFQWKEIFHVWHIYSAYLVAFLLHNFLLANLLVYQHKRLLYFSGVVCLLAMFIVHRCQQKPLERRPAPHWIDIEKRKGSTGELFGPPGQKPDGTHRPSEFGDPTDAVDHLSPLVSRIDKRPEKMSPMDFGLNDIFQLAILVLTFGMNLGVKFFFKSLDDQKKLKEMETEKLEGQLAYLKYQINPHFFMNTLNNIHALVDIDPEKAKSCIIHLSKLMRYMLYETDQIYVPMTKEIEFMENYVRLMCIRYTDKLDFEIQQPDDGAGVWIPPLLFIAFVENAFKHGVSYRHPSYIKVGAMRYQKNDEERLTWTCRNSKHPNSLVVSQSDLPKQGGVGLANVRRRLELIYGDNYTLDINDGETEFSVRMDIPLSVKPN